MANRPMTIYDYSDNPGVGAYTRMCAPDATSKICYGCKVRLKYALFGKNTYSPDGLMTKCKECVRKYQKEYIKKRERERIAQAAALRNKPQPVADPAPEQPTPLGDQWWLTDPLMSQIIPASTRPKAGSGRPPASAPAPLITAPPPVAPSKPLPKPVVVAWNAPTPRRDPLQSLPMDEDPDNPWFTP